MNRPKMRPQAYVGKGPKAPNRPPSNRPPNRAPRLSPEEAERRRADSLARERARKRAAAREAAIRERIKRENKKRRAAAAKLFFYRFLVYLVILGMILSFFALVFFTNLKKTDKINDDEFIYYLADEKKTYLPYAKVMRGGVMYVNFSKISEKFGLAVTGSYDELRFVSHDNAEYVRFFPDDRAAEINNNRIFLEAPPILEGNDLFVPACFVLRYMDGISVKHNEEERTLTIKRVSYGAEDKAITFTLKDSSPISAIPEPDDIGQIGDTSET